MHPNHPHAATGHMCVGPSCWVCGEPDQLRRLRHAVVAALHPEVGPESHRLGRLVVDAIRDDLTALMHRDLSKTVWATVDRALRGAGLTRHDADTLTRAILNALDTPTPDDLGQI